MGEMTIETMLERIGALAAGMAGFQVHGGVDVRVRRPAGDAPWRVTVDVESHPLGRLSDEAPCPHPSEACDACGAGPGAPCRDPGFVAENEALGIRLRVDGVDASTFEATVRREVERATAEVRS